VRWGLTALYSLVAVVTVGPHLNEPCDWLQLFGRLADAHSVRRFWSHSWNQTGRSTTELPIQYLLHDILKVKRYLFIQLRQGIRSILLGLLDALLRLHSSPRKNFFIGQALAI
jgi:hypothetical protein